MSFGQIVCFSIPQQLGVGLLYTTLQSKSYIGVPGNAGVQSCSILGNQGNIVTYKTLKRTTAKDLGGSGGEWGGGHPPCGCTAALAGTRSSRSGYP